MFQVQKSRLIKAAYQVGRTIAVKLFFFYYRNCLHCHVTVTIRVEICVEIGAKILKMLIEFCLDFAN